MVCFAEKNHTGLQITARSWYITLDNAQGEEMMVNEPGMPGLENQNSRQQVQHAKLCSDCKAMF